MTIPIPGKCRHCGCTEDNACTLGNGDPCCWADNQCTVCSNPACLRQESARKAFAPRPQRRTSADINKLIRQRGRKKRRAA
jgi:hypothetical protein